METVFQPAPFDYLIECSAEPSVLAGQDGRPDYLFQTNLVGAYNCLEKARRWGSKFIFLSTSRVYPIARIEAQPWREEKTRFVWEQRGANGISALGVTEQMDLKGARSLYGFTKLAAEQLIEEYRTTYGIQCSIRQAIEGIVCAKSMFCTCC